MVMHPSLSMEEINKYFRVIHEAAGRKWLIKTRDR